ncbi:hypothetical protein [Lysobacter sp. cf310]|uniref:hypothetical protein n=1 Tax=Lysobacter sp. cf310 TaxID=1761790 RepID=UPI0008DF05D8|nr:hypothetical protein [Lysobacter sp. cf310]SFK48246.1 hypothetical protein SAMN04487938_1021 [Lysobacter sp. cf310]
MSLATHKFAHALLGAAFGLALLGWSGAAAAACPGASPCETIHVYRIQSWPTIQVDAAGRPLISIQEANGADEKAFTLAVAGQVGSKALAIRYNVTRIEDPPNDYCECNLENKNKGCPSNLAPELLHQCARVCRRGALDSCTGTGFNVKQDSGGKWYAFPAATQCGGARNVWKKHAFGAVKPTSCDWLENSRVIKEVSCIATALAADPLVGLDALFNNGAPCPAIAEATLEYLP